MASVKKIGTEVTYEITVTQTQLDKMFAAFAAFMDCDLDDVFYELEDYVEDNQYLIEDENGETVSGLEVSRYT